MLSTQRAQPSAAATSTSKPTAAVYPPSAPHPSLPVSDSLSAYYSSLLATQPSLSAVQIRSHPTKGRYLHSLTHHSPSTRLFTEPAALAASDDPAVCVSCHQRHEGKAVCDGYRRWKGVKSVVNAMSAVADEFGYGESRGLMVADWIVNMQQVREREKEEKMKKDGVSLAASFSLPPPAAPTFSFSLPDEASKATVDSSNTAVSTDASVSSPSPNNPVDAVAVSDSVSPDPALSCVLSLDAGSSSFLASHRPFASALWQCLPLPLRRLYSLNELNQLVCILEVNAHELVDEQGEKGEGLFPFFAMIEHSCYENCAFTALSASSSSSTGPSVSVHCLRPIAASSALSISYCPPYLPTSQRRAYLETSYHFHCVCALCSGERPDKCRAFVCECGGCVWVWGEGKELSDWRCSDCALSAGAAAVGAWREVEEWVGGVVAAVMAHMEEEADSKDQTAATKRKRAAKRREDIAQLTVIAEAAMRNERLQPNDHEPLLTPATVQSSSKSLNPISEEKEGDEQEEASEEQESPVNHSAQPATVDGVEQTLDSLSLTKSQLKNKKRREKLKQHKLATTHPSSSISPHPHIGRIHPSHHHCHTLLDLLTSHYASVGEFRRAAVYAAQRVRNVRRVLCETGGGAGGGSVHWMEAVEWSVLADLYGECGEWERRKQAFEQCWQVNRQCFGDEAASSMYAKKQMMTTDPTDIH